MVYQNPGTALNPSIRVGDQVAEVFRLAGMAREEANDRARAMFEKVRISDPGHAMRRYPHQLSGGMQQRVVIAMALGPIPQLLILDEPTTALDATVEAEVLDLIAALRREYGTALLYISHNLGVVARMCERVGVLYAGRLVEVGETETVFSDPRHPYTVGLLRCVPRWGSRKDEGVLDTIPGLPPPVGARMRGCVYAERCGLAVDHCRQEPPPLLEVGSSPPTGPGGPPPPRGGRVEVGSSPPTLALPREGGGVVGLQRELHLLHVVAGQRLTLESPNDGGRQRSGHVPRLLGGRQAEPDLRTAAGGTVP
jgi:peptide/nickel transport system ATP-binding protein